MRGEKSLYRVEKGRFCLTEKAGGVSFKTMNTTPLSRTLAVVFTASLAFTFLGEKAEASVILDAPIYTIDTGHTTTTDGNGGIRTTGSSTGFSFTPSENLVIEALGYIDINFDSESTNYPDGYGNGLSSSKTVSIFVTSTEALLASVTVPAGTDGDLRDGVFRYTALAESITLTSGVSYTLAGSPTGSDRIWDRTSQSGLPFDANAIGSLQERWGDAFPQNTQTAGNIYPTANAWVAVPEPAEVASVLGGLGMLLTLVVRRRRSIGIALQR